MSFIKRNDSEKNENASNEANEKSLHWSDEKEVVSSSRPLKFSFALVKHLPSPVVFSFVYPVAFFYYLTSKRARKETFDYQRRLKAYSNGKVPKRINSFAQILSFAMTIVEKMEGWIGKYDFEQLSLQEDQHEEFFSLLKEGKGAIVIGSHLGNIELLRSVSSMKMTGIGRELKVTILMEINSTEQFNNTLKEINPKSAINVINTKEIGPETMEKLEETVAEGGLVVFAGDRTSSNEMTRKRALRLKFLGEDADFPYGVFLIPALMKVPVFYMFGLRTKNASLFPRYNMFIEKSAVNFECDRKERDERIEALCGEYVQKLEKYCMKFPYQWYNFYNFWRLE